MILAGKECLSQGFHGGWTDEQKSLPHFSFLLFKAKLTSGICGFPLDVRIHAICLCVSFGSFYVSALNSVPVAHLAKSARHNSLNRFFFRGVVTLSLMPVRPGR